MVQIGNINLDKPQDNLKIKQLEVANNTSIYSIHNSQTKVQENNILSSENNIDAIVKSLYDTDGVFDFKTFSNYSPEKQKEIIQYFIAQNKFLCEEKKSIQEWDAIEDKTSLIADVNIGDINEERYTACVATLLSRNETDDEGYIFNDVKFDKFDFSNIKWLDELTDYCASYIGKEGLLSEDLSRLLNHREKNSAAVIHFLLMDDVLNSISDPEERSYFEGIRDDVKESVEEHGIQSASLLESSEINRFLAATGMGILDLEIVAIETELNGLDQESGLYEDLNKELEKLEIYRDFLKSQKENGTKDIEFEASIKLDGIDEIVTDYSLCPHEQISALYEYAEDLDLQDKKNIILRVRDELGNELLAFNLFRKIFEESSEKDQQELVQSSDFVGLSALNHHAVTNKEVAASLIQKIQVLYYGGKHEVLHYVARNANIRLFKDIASIGIDAVEIKFGENVLSQSDAETQAEGLENISQNSGLAACTFVGTNLDQAHEDNQTPYLKKFTANKVVANAVNKNGTITRFVEKNQVEAFKILQNRFEQPDYTPEESLEQLNTLTDQIHNFHQNNYEALYDLAMNSSNQKASEYAKSVYQEYVSNVVSSSKTETSKQSDTSSTTSEVETTPAQYTAYQTNPISNDRVEPVQTPKTEAAKSVYEQIVSGKASASKIAEVFNSLSSDEKVNVLKSLTLSEIVKMPVSICGLCPEFIPQFVAAKKGIEVIKTVPDAAAATILHMKKSNDREVQKDLQVFMIEHPDQFMKISVANAREKLGVREDDNRLINHIRFRA